MINALSMLPNRCCRSTLMFEKRAEDDMYDYREK
jgi:hypothetical protein